MTRTVTDCDETIRRMAQEISDTMRDYLAEIYRLGERSTDERGYVSTSSLADLLDVSAPAVNRMVTKLKDLGLLLHEPYQGISLTDEGKRAAMYMLRRHRIAESFLVSVMGFGWHEVHEEANRIAPTLSEPLVQRMEEMAGQPTYCPHGEPIPHPDGQIDEIDDVLLTQAEAENHYRITRVLTREQERLEYIEALGLLPGSEVEVLHIAPFNGPMQLKVGAEYRIIGHNLAELIRAQKKT